MRVELMVLVICKTLRQNERVYLEFSVFLFVLQVFLFVSFCFGTILYLQPNQFVMIKLALISNGGKKQNLLQHHSSKASILRLSFLYPVPVTDPTGPHGG